MLPAAVSIRGYAGNHSELRAGSCGCSWDGRGGSCIPSGVRISSLPPHQTVRYRADVVKIGPGEEEREGSGDSATGQVGLPEVGTVGAGWYFP